MHPSRADASPRGAVRGLTPADEELLAEMAGRLVRARLAPVAVLWLESSRPVAFLGSQVLHVLDPLVTALVPSAPVGRFAALLQERGALDRLLELVTAAESADRRGEPAARGRGGIDGEAAP
ncbi:MAG: hypothetical protein R6X25_04805 [Candidatus Krumholzibacteriia bacterium]